MLFEMNQYVNANAKQVDDSFYVRQNELIHKTIKLQVLKDLYEATSAMIEQKKQLLKEETYKLDKLHDDVWTLQNEVCDKVWDFSVKHDFNTLFNQYPYIPSGFSFDCGCENTSYKAPEENAELKNLLLEIQELESDLEFENCNTLALDLIRFQNELQECQKESPEIQRLKSEINKSKQKIINLKAKVQASSHKQDNKVAVNNGTIFPENINSQFSPDSSITATCTEKTNLFNFPPMNNDAEKNRNLEKTLDKLNDNPPSSTGYFIRASTYLKDLNQPQFQNTPSCEKIIAEAVSNNDKPSSSDNKRKKFVFKTKSLITQRKSLKKSSE